MQIRSPWDSRSRGEQSHHTAGLNLPFPARCIFLVANGDTEVGRPAAGRSGGAVSMGERVRPGLVMAGSGSEYRG